MAGTNTPEEPEPTEMDGDGGLTRTDRFVRMFGAAYHRIYACVLTLLPDPTDADDVLQETSLVLWRKFDEFRPDGDFVKWACGVAYNQARKFRRERARAGLQFSDQLMERIAVARTENWELLETRRQVLAKCLEKLSDSDRELVRQCYEQPTTIKQAAEQMGRPVNTVYKALKRIRTALFECIDRTLRLEEGQ